MLQKKKASSETAKTWYRGMVGRGYTSSGIFSLCLKLLAIEAYEGPVDSYLPPGTAIY